MKPIAKFFVSLSFKILNPRYDISKNIRDRINPIIYITRRTIVKMLIVIVVVLLEHPLYDIKKRNLPNVMNISTKGDDITILNRALVSIINLLKLLGLTIKQYTSI